MNPYSVSCSGGMFEAEGRAIQSGVGFTNALCCCSGLPDGGLCHNNGFGSHKAIHQTLPTRC